MASFPQIICKWLHKHGTGCKRSSDGQSFPLQKAARYGKLDVVKWLCKNGASEDIRRRTGRHGTSPLDAALRWQNEGYLETAAWLILKGGALCREGDDSGEFDVTLMRESFARTLSEDKHNGIKKRFLWWAQEAVED